MIVAPGLAAATAAAPERPISGTCELTFVPTPLAPPLVQQIDVGTCRISHLGRTEFVGIQVINPVTGTQSGERTLTAANGDQLRGTHVGTSTMSSPGVVSFVATMTFVGGTGRFAHATGTATLRGTANLAERKAKVSLNGRISY